MRLRVVHGRAVPEVNVWSVTVILPNGTQLVLLYEKAANAKAVWDELEMAAQGMRAAFVEDDFGTELRLPADQVMGLIVSLQDVRRGLDGGVRRALLQNEAQARASRQAAAHQPAIAMPPALRM